MSIFRNSLHAALWLFVSMSSVLGDSRKSDQPEYLEAIVITEGVAWYQQVARQAGIPVNWETTTSSQKATSIIDVFDGEEISLGSYLLELKSLGFEIHAEPQALLVSTPGAVKFEKNPLDVILDGFYFEGSHKDFSDKLSLLFSDILSSLFPDEKRVIATGGSRKVVPLEDQSYTILIEKEVSVRDVLMYISTQYGIGWSVNMADQAVPVQTGSDGISYTRGMFFSFWRN